ncbi:ribosomal lysine N-methyltransferase set10 [Naviculisporaceae sp. PSN 640]
MKEAEAKRFSELTSWACQHGASLHPSIEIYNDDLTKFSLRVKQSASPLPADGAESFPAVSCPYTITLSFLNALSGGPFAKYEEQTTPNPTFPPKFMDQVPPHVIGRFFLIHEYLKGRDSFWWPYIATLPQPEQISSWTLPAFWPEEDVDVLEGTNAHVAIQEIQANVKREFKQARKILKEEDFQNWQDYSKMLYNWAFCIFTSRSFRPSLILPEPVKAKASSLLPADCEIDDFSILQPLFDIANHKMTAGYTWDIVSNPEACCLLCPDKYQPGEQVFNNYGLKSNSELLLGYGFILPETPELHNDYVHVRKRGGATEKEADDRPKDFLISLRPMSDPSSVLGNSRQLSANASQLHTISQFAHFEPGLIYDLAFAISTDEEKALIGDLISTTAQPQTGQVPEGLQELVGRIQQALSAKLQYDYQLLEQTDPASVYGEEESGEPWKPANRNQELALEYRKQCEKVLLAALRSVAPSSW